MKRALFTFVVMFWTSLSMHAQDEVPVPDLSQLNIPRAAHILNLLGLEIGEETAIGWTAESGQEQNTIVEQAIAPGTMTARGTAIDISVLRSPNMRLIYDDNDLTAINLTDQGMTVNGLVFASTEGTTASYPAAQSAGRLDGSECIQLWSISRNNAKDVEGCRSILWRTTRDSSIYFWTQTNGVTRFNVVENGIERAVCDAAPPNSQDSPMICEFFLAGGSAGGGDVAGFIYLAYTMDAIAVINQTPDQWMVTNQTTFVNNNPNMATPGAELIVGDPNLLREEFQVGAGDVTRLAPQQCIVLASVADPDLPQPCNRVAQRTLDAQTAFWHAEFGIKSVTDGRQRVCPAASSSRLTLCIVPR